MRPLLVLAGNQKQYLEWAREHREEMQARGLEPRYLPAKTLNHLGYSKCFYLEIGTTWEAGYPEDLYRYFRANGILNVRQVEGQVA